MESIMKKKQVYNPYLPSWEYIPDGEPHVFDGRVYVYGSHDRFNGNLFCMNDYVCYSADVHDLTAWKYEGIIFRKRQDPRNDGDVEHCLWAPDVVQGPDGRYYLYYCLDYLPQIGVAVCDTPAGRYEFLGLVRYADGTVLGERKGDYIQFDPGVFIDDDGEIYLYSGNAPARDTDTDHKNSQVMTLEEDMLTIKKEPRLLIPTIHTSEGTGFEGHEFFEASSIRRIDGTYYFVYSSVKSHELCYCTSDKPDEGYRYGGTLVSIGDIFLDGREEKDALNFLGNTHGGMELIDGQWYIFYHRQTNRTQFSRQGCAEKIQILPDGSIPQVEITSCGLNQGPLRGKGSYEARIACNLRGKNGTVMSVPEKMTEEYPYFTQDERDRRPEFKGQIYVAGEPVLKEPEERKRKKKAKDGDAKSTKAESAGQESPVQSDVTRGSGWAPVQYIANLRDGALVGYKYFEFQDLREITLRVRPHQAALAGKAGHGKISGVFRITTEPGGRALGEIPVEIPEGNFRAWREFSGMTQIPDGVRALYLEYRGEGALDFVGFELI